MMFSLFRSFTVFLFLNLHHFQLQCDLLLLQFISLGLNVRESLFKTALGIIQHHNRLFLSRLELRNNKNMTEFTFDFPLQPFWKDGFYSLLKMRKSSKHELNNIL